MRPLPSLLLAGAVAFGGAGPASAVSGSLKPEFSVTSSRRLLRSPLRLMFQRRESDLRLEAAWTLTPSAGNPALGEDDLGGGGIFRICDPDRVIASTSGDGTSFSLVHDLDRLSLSLAASAATLTAGRQAIYWGVAKSVSPTDFIAPIRYGARDTEYRTGVDALRSVFPVGTLSELDAGYAWGEDAKFEESACWFRGRFYLAQTDAMLLAACFRENLMAGGSLNRTVGRGTGWAETAVVWPGRLSDEGGGDAFWSLSAGYDRSWFGAALYGYLEYHFSSPGATSPEEYRSVLSGPAGGRGGIYLAGRHYLCPGLSWNPGALWTLTGGAMVNLADPSAYLSLSGEYSAGQNMVLQWGANFGAGRGPGSMGTLRSEFGGWPDLVYARLGYYF
ncbi:MAG: hypothetical protein R6U39_10190 [Candidatus Aegiribacteria sp.]